MELELFNDGMERSDIKDQPFREGCRGIIKKDDKYLMVHVKKWDITTFPGGGLEPGETREECVIREVLEETGVVCTVIAKTVTLTEYFIDSIWRHNFFLCEFVEDTGETHFTEEEKEIDLEVQWMTLDDVMDTFENNITLHEHGPMIHNREFLGLINSI